MDREHLKQKIMKQNPSEGTLNKTTKLFLKSPT